MDTNDPACLAVVIADVVGPDVRGIEPIIFAFRLFEAKSRHPVVTPLMVIVSYGWHIVLETSFEVVKIGLKGWLVDLLRVSEGGQEANAEGDGRGRVHDYELMYVE